MSSPPSHKMNSQAILFAYNSFKTTVHKQHLDKIRQSLPLRLQHELTDDELDNVYNSSVSCFQSKGGKFLESHIETLLINAGIPFKPQVHLNSDGIIVESQGCTVPDIVFGIPQIGDHISNYIVLSLKTTSRERAKLDTAWTSKHPPKLFLYGTLEDDYPQPTTFEEGPIRKIITAKPKKKDNRMFKLGFEHLIECVSQGLKPTSP